MCPSGKPYSEACERNREPILAVLREHFADRRHVLEIGSGTGQHAVYFAQAMPWLVWQASDLAENLSGIQQWLDGAALPNTPAPLDLDVRGPWPEVRADAVFTANTLHIMAWPAVDAFIAGAGRLLARVPGAVLVVYGPFNRGGRHTSESNRRFDAWLKARDPGSGLRDTEAVDALARGAGFLRVADVAMPANNRCLVWRRQAAPAH
jgi:cyclopropane fatty-acyl-phospholipid synthase-like methyltransferase